MIKIKAKELFYILVGALVITAVAGSVAYYLASARVKAKTQKLQEKMAVEIVTNEKVDQLTLLQKQYQKIEPILPQIETALPPSKKQAEIALQLQQVAASAGIAWPGISFATSSTLPTATTQTVPESGVLALPITLQLSGTYEQMQSFLTGVEKLNRYIKINSISITKANAGTRTLSFSLKMNAYLKP